MKLQISKHEDAQPGPLSAWDLVVKLDDQDITRSLLSLDLSIARDSIVTCALSLQPGEINVDADALVALLAIAKDQEKEETP